nr:pitrilysin family protein [Aestuariibacter salexigens]
MQTPTQIAARVGDAESLSLPYISYQLDNGLTVILHQDTSDPLVHVDVTYHVGSAREEPGKSGFAHFFEHMMFQGSKNVADEEHFRLITEAGGDMNGTTNSDRTNYYQTVPANQLEKVLWLEADRMGFLLDAVTQKKFENQRETVKNERGQNVDNQPYGLRDEKVAEALYPLNHPYSWPTIGYIDDLNRVNVNDLKAFFKRWYGPNNAVLTIGGDIDIDTTKRWVAKYFAPIPRGPEVSDLPKQPVNLTEDRQITLEDAVHLPLIQVTFPTVYARHEDEAALDVLADILGGGKTSLFYKNLVKTGDAVQALVNHPCRELACEFQMLALANPAKDPSLAHLREKFSQTLDEFEQRGVNQDDLNRTKTSIETSTIYGLQSVAGKVSSLAYNQVFAGQPDMVQFDLARYRAVTAEDVMRVYRTYVKGKHSVTLSIVPHGQTQLAAAPTNFTPPRRELNNEQPMTAEVQPVEIDDDFDRSIVPMAGPNPAVTLPELWHATLENGIAVTGTLSTETPTTSITLSMEGGPLLDPVDKAGLASLTALMMNESTTARRGEDMSNALALLGSRVRFSANGRFIQVRVSSLTKHLDETLTLMDEMLFSPAFDQQEFNRLKQQMLQSMQQQANDPSYLANRARDRVMFGENNRVSLPDTGTIKTLQTITLDDVKQFYHQYVSPSRASIVVVGDTAKHNVLEKLTFLGAWQGLDYVIPEFNTFPQYSQSSIYLVDKPDAAQSVVKLVKRDIPFDATGEHFMSKLMNFPLGGMFNSRINLNLREDKGYTYGAYSRFNAGKTLGVFEAGAELNKDKTLEGINEILAEINRYQQSGPTGEELVLLRNAYTQADALNYETPWAKAGFIRQLMVFGLDADFPRQQQRIIRSVTRDQLTELAQRKLDTQTMQIIVVGDKSELLPTLEQLNRPIEVMQLEL